LDGWGIYKFGMTPDEVRGLRGVPLSSPEFGEVIGTRFLVMHGMQSVSLDSRRYELSLYFTPQEQGRLRLAWIDLIDERPSGSPLQCESDFQNVLRQLEKQFGSLSPPPHDAFNPLDASATGEESKGLQDGVSRYVLKSLEPPRGYALQAMKAAGSSTVSVEARGAPSTASPAVLGCNLRI